MIRSLFDGSDEGDSQAESGPRKKKSVQSLSLFETGEDPTVPETTTASIGSDEKHDPHEAARHDPVPFASAEPYILSETKPDSIAETARKSGLAWSAGIVLFGSIAFMMLIGWGADLLFGTSPGGLIVGMVIGAAIGFFQLFRLTSQIFRK